eukprot:7511346-Alexandrium_andersonii.AAC.1
MGTRRRRPLGTSRACRNCWTTLAWKPRWGTCAASGCGSPSLRLREWGARWSGSRPAGRALRRRC